MGNILSGYIEECRCLDQPQLKSISEYKYIYLAKTSLKTKFSILRYETLKVSLIFNLTVSKPSELEYKPYLDGKNSILKEIYDRILLVAILAKTRPNILRTMSTISDDPTRVLTRASVRYVTL